MSGRMKCEWFKCDGCGNLKSMSERRVAKAAYTAFDADALKSLQYYVYHVQLCAKCSDDNKEKEVSSNASSI